MTISTDSQPPVLLRSRSLMSGIFDHPPQDRPTCSVVTHSSSAESLESWRNVNDSPPSPPPHLPPLIDDCTEQEHARRIAIARSHGHHYDEAAGVRAILDALTEHERTFLSDENMPLRHYRAEKGNLTEAIRKIKCTLRWREEFGVDDIRRCFDRNNHSRQLNHLAEIISRENETGKIYCRGYDRQGRAILYLTPGRENSTSEMDNMRHLVYHLERAIACTRRKSGRQKVCIVIGYEGFKLANAPPLSTTKHTLTILQGHYPERMFRAYICDPPLVFRTFWNIIRHFVDPTTLEKIAFCSGGEGQRLLERDFDVDTTERQAGGRMELRPFDSEEFLYDTPFDYAYDEEVDDGRSFLGVAGNDERD
ncbi:hypothetical protein HJC23_001130 [Cyclotella cryptica]|uniref:CRAL-TRIO domain-containing protein n=1 Tax=Cyclotella cryptica TaxID=29204 RepID=A0ABD3PH83_9STRA|eukprot:CCRYP_014454-RA/>CCRYP_014454-RA protein AED:0.05 eAED:-0.00 QI:0/0/0/1/0/0/2/0/364